MTSCASPAFATRIASRSPLSAATLPSTATRTFAYALIANCSWCRHCKIHAAAWLRFRRFASCGDRAHGLARGIAHDGESKLDVELAAILMYGTGHHGLVSKPGMPCGNRLVVAAPVRGAQMLRNDEIEAPANGLVRRIAEKRLRSRVPDPDIAVAVGEDDRIGRLLDQAAGQNIVFGEAHVFDIVGLNIRHGHRS